MDLFIQFFIMLLCLFMAELTCRQIVIYHSINPESDDFIASILLAFTSVALFALFNYLLFSHFLNVYVFDFSKYLNFGYFTLLAFLTFIGRSIILQWKYHFSHIFKINKHYDKMEKIMNSPAFKG